MAAAPRVKSRSLFERETIVSALRESLLKLDPRHVVRNPVMFVVEVGSVLTTAIAVRDIALRPAGAEPVWFTVQVSIWLWFTVLFANFAEAVAEGRGKAQAATLRKMR